MTPSKESLELAYVFPTFPLCVDEPLAPVAGLVDGADVDDKVGHTSCLFKSLGHVSLLVFIDRIAFFFAAS